MTLFDILGNKVQEDGLPGLDTAEEGQMLIVKNVDENGSPSELEAVDRTHWVEVSGMSEILPECQPAFDASEGCFVLEAAPSFVVGETYIINWNGDEYKCVAQDASAIIGQSAVELGNGSTAFPDSGLIGNNEPFAIAAMNGMVVVIPLDGTTSLTISIYQDGEVVHKLDEKFIPGTIARTADLTPLQEGIEDAKTAATNAQATATTASSNALSAKTAATKAQKAAETAQTSADEAKTEASNANTAAQAAQTSVDGKMSATDPVGTGSFSMNRLSGSTVGTRSHAEGVSGTASGAGSHAEGNSTIASGDNSHAEGMRTTASGISSHAENSNTKASGNGSHAEGYMTEAKGNYSHAEGRNTIATDVASHVQGTYNIEDTAGKYAHIVGNGDSSARSNAHTIDWEGVAWFKNGLQVGGNAQDDGAKKVLLDGEAVKTVNGIAPDEAGNVTIQTGGGSGGAEPVIVTYDAETLVASHSPEEIKALWEAGTNVVLSDGIYFYRLVLADSTVAMFTCETISDGSGEVNVRQAKVFYDKTVKNSTTRLNNQPLIFTGAVEAAYNGMSAVEVEIPSDDHIRDLINTALGVIENGTY